MAATVAHGLLVLNATACEAVRRHGGRARLAAFEQQLAHELAHLGLRRSGLRLPVWLEEGVCEHVSGAPWDDARLGDALPQADEFAAFVRACMGLPARAGQSPRPGDWSPDTTLLRFSDAPVDVNPAYVLAHGFVRHLVQAEGLEALLDAWSARGLRARCRPFGPDDDAPAAAAPTVADRLERWLDAETARLAAASPFPDPMRVLALGRQALVYHRIVGGHAWVEHADAAGLAALAGRNLALGEVEALLAGHPQRDELLARWRVGRLARQRGFHLRLTIEGGCNMGCSYCYEGEKRRQPMSVETADRAIAAWRDLLGPDDLPGSTIRIFGGEPFMNWPLMRHVFETAAVGLPPGSVAWYLNTNGTLVREDQAAYLAARPGPLMVHLSLDGVAAVNDRDRVFTNGRGTFDRVDRAAHRLLAAGVTVNLSMVLTPHNAHGLPALLDYAAGLRDRYPAAPPSLSIKPVIGPALDEADAQVMHAALRAGLARGAALGLDIGGEPLRAANLLFQDSAPTGHFCGVSGRELYVAPDGQLLVCHAMPDTAYAGLDAVAAAGRIPVPDEIRRRHAGEVDGCAGCEVEGLCGGGCMAQSRMAHGSVARKPSDYFCRMMKGSFRDAVEAGLQARAAASR
ncbi:radical SAM protein [Piscinibacter sakaiensis]